MTNRKKLNVRPVITRQVLADIKRAYKVSHLIKICPEMREIAEQFGVKEALDKAKESQKNNGE